MLIYPFHLKILDFCYRFLRLRNFKKLAIGQAFTRFLKFRRRKNQVAKKPVSSGGMGISKNLAQETLYLNIFFSIKTRKGSSNMYIVYIEE